MKRRSHICIAGILIAGIIGGCSDERESLSNEPRSADHVVAESHTSISEQKYDEIDLQPKTSSRSADAHTHGDAELAVVLEKGVVTIELDSPLYNILGFEHAPETEAQEAAAQKAEQQLARGSELFTFNAKANCKSLSKNQHISLFGNTAADEDHDEYHHEDHDDEEDHDVHDSEEPHNNESHNDILLTYEFGCQHPLKLSYLNVNLFEFFEELSEVDVTFLGRSTQKQGTLNRKQRQLDITP